MLFSSIFGPKEKIDYIKEINKDIHKEIKFFIMLEEASRIKVKLANEFLVTWNKGDLVGLKTYLQSLKSLIEKGVRLIPRFQKRVREQDTDLMQIIHLSNTIFERKQEGNISEELKKIEQVLNFEIETLAKQLEIINEPIDELLLKRKRINELLKLIQLEARVFIEENEILEELQKNIERLGAFQRSGLVTIHQLAEQLQREIINNKILTALYQIMGIKEEAEKLILEKDFLNPILIKAQKMIAENREGALIEKLEFYKPRIMRIIPVLEKAATRIESQKVKIILTILNYIFEEKLMSKVKKHLAAEAVAMKNNKFDEFMIHYQLEKILFWNFSRYLEKIGATFLLDEIVRAGYVNILDQDNDFFRNSLENVLLQILLLFLSPLLSVIEKIEEKKLVKEDKTYALIKIMEERPDEFKQENVELARALMEKYGMKIIGTFVEKDLINLKEVLEIHYPEEVRRFLRRIAFTEGKLDYYGGHHNTAFYSLARREVRLFSNSSYKEITHELAHARTFELPPSFREQWIIANGGEKSYKEARWLPVKDRSRWNFFEGRYGYARPGGSGNCDEDIATFVEAVMNLRRGTVFLFKKDARYITPYIRVYKEKALLLWKYGLIASEDYKRVISLLDSFS